MVLVELVMLVTLVSLQVGARRFARDGARSPSKIKEPVELTLQWGPFGGCLSLFEWERAFPRLASPWNNLTF